MTEIPEHLLQRSRERRQALGLQSESPQAGAPAATPAAVEPAPAPARAVEPAAPAVPAPVVTQELPPPAPVAAPPRGPHKTKVPAWVMPVLVALPLWAFLYPGAFGSHKKVVVEDPLVIGQQVSRLTLRAFQFDRHRRYPLLRALWRVVGSRLLDRRLQSNFWC